MSLNNVPSSERTHIGIFGKRNAGKSSVINAITGQNLAIVSDIKGTTTDPVLKSMELLPLGPVVLIDTPGLDDEGDLGHLRIQKAYQILNKTDIALLVIDGTAGMTAEDYQILDRIRAKNIPYLIVFNKADLAPDADTSDTDTSNADTSDTADAANVIWVSTVTGLHIQELKERLATLLPDEDSGKTILGDLIRPSDFIILVVPIDKAAPKGRLILPQQQTIRDILDSNGISVVVKEDRLKETLEGLGKKPRMVITDSQVFKKVSQDTPGEIPLTSFSILFARYKGNLETTVQGARALENLKDGDQVLISEGCTHHRQCGDIGTVKLPAWIQKYTGKNLKFSFTSGTEFPEELGAYSLIVHCGGCMLNEREMKYRLSCAQDQGVPMTNYGILIAYMNGILERSLEPFGL